MAALLVEKGTRVVIDDGRVERFGVIQDFEFNTLRYVIRLDEGATARVLQREMRPSNKPLPNSALDITSA